MDHDAPTPARLKLPEAPRPVRRSDIEAVLQRADEALQLSLEQPQEEEAGEATFVSTGEPLRAPVGETEAVHVEAIHKQDGLSIRRHSELRAEIARFLRALPGLRVQSHDVQITGLPDEQAAERLYYSERPFEEAIGGDGDILGIYADGERPLDAPTSRVRQQITPTDNNSQPFSATLLITYEPHGGITAQIDE